MRLPRTGHARAQSLRPRTPAHTRSRLPGSRTLPLGSGGLRAFDGPPCLDTPSIARSPTTCALRGSTPGAMNAAARSPRPAACAPIAPPSAAVLTIARNHCPQYPGSRGPGAVPPAPPPPSPAIASLIERIRAQQAKSASAGRGTQTPGPKEPARGGPTIAPIAPRVRKDVVLCHPSLWHPHALPARHSAALPRPQRSPSDIAAGAAAARRILGPNPRAGASPQSDTPPSPTPAAPVNSVAALWERAMAAKERREQRDRLLGERIRAKMQGAREGGAVRGLGWVEWGLGCGAVWRLLLQCRVVMTLF